MTFLIKIGDRFRTVPRKKKLKLLISTKWLIVGFLLVIAVILSRFLYLGQVPTSISHDEIINAFEAKMASINGSGTTENWRPWSLTPVHPAFAELTATLMLPFYWLPLPIEIATKLPYVLMSLVLPLVIALVTYALIKSKRTAIIAGLISFFNPWIWQFGRLAFDSYFSLFFLFAGLLPLLYGKRGNKLWALPLFFLAFYQYQGHKLVFLPWILIWSMYVIIKETSQNLEWRKLFSKKQKQLKKIITTFWVQNWVILTVVFASTLLFLFYLLVQLPTHSSRERVTTILTPRSEEIIEITNERRRLSLTSRLNRININAYTIWVEKVLAHYAEVFSLARLFFGDSSAPYAVWFHGQLYWVDFVLILAGLYALLKNKKTHMALIFLILSLLAAPLPAVLSVKISMMFRASMVVPILLIIAAAGINLLLEQKQRWLTVSIILIYVVSIGYFTFVYFWRYPLASAEREYFTEKILTNYATRVLAEKKVTVYTTEPEFTYRAYLYYTNNITAKNWLEIKNAFLMKDYKLQNFRVTSDCFDMSTLAENEVAIVDRDAYICTEKGKVVWDKLSPEMVAVLTDHLTLAAVKDSGEVYAIYNDNLCTGTELGTYLRLTELKQFEPKTMDDQTFCRTWITDVRGL